MSFIHPMFHLKPNPRPPELVGCETPGQDVDSSATIVTSREEAIEALICRLQEAHRVAVLVTAFGVRQPFAGPSRIIEIKHGSDRIDAQAIDMEAVEPIERVRGQDIRDLAPAEIVDRGVPVGMEAPARVRMFVEGRAIELGEAMLVGGKVSRNPIEDHAEPGAMRPSTKRWKPAGSPCRRVGENRPIG